MNIFKNEKTEKLIELLRRSCQNFRLDPTAVRYRLMQNLDAKIPMHVQAHSWHLLGYAAAAASILLVVTGSFAFASNAVPGDKLFPLNKFGEQVILKLPMPTETKARIQTTIVTRRLRALDQVSEIRKLQTVEESDTTLNAAIEAVTANKKALETSGRKKAAENLTEVLGQLENLAERHERSIELLQSENDDDDLKINLNIHLQNVKQAKQKAQRELKRERAE